jgi:hypothetical protein
MTVPLEFVQPGPTQPASGDLPQYSFIFAFSSPIESNNHPRRCQSSSDQIETSQVNLSVATYWTVHQTGRTLYGSPDVRRMMGLSGVTAGGKLVKALANDVPLYRMKGANYDSQEG